MPRIVTHGGVAHRDEFLSCCLLLAEVDGILEITRRDPSPSELNDPDIWVLDVGRVHNPSLSNFDHHQLDGYCTIDLLNQHFNWGIEESWLTFSRMLDVKGPAAAYGQAPNPAWISPIEREIINIFGDNEIIVSIHPLFCMMRMIGTNILRDITGYKEYKAAFIYRNRDGIAVVLHAPHAQSPYFKRIKEIIEETVIVSPYIDRDTNEPTVGWTLYSKDTNKVNFKDMKSCWFIHANGFLAHTRTELLQEVLDEVRLCTKA